MSAATVTSPVCDEPTCTAAPDAGSHLCPQHDPILCGRCLDAVPVREVIRILGEPLCPACAWDATGRDTATCPARACDGETHYTGQRDPFTNEDVEAGPCPLAGAR